MRTKFETVNKASIFFAFILILFVLIGFFRSYFRYIPNSLENIRPLIHFHFVFLMSWVLLLVIQPLLIKFDQRKTHQFLGRISYLIAPIIVGSLISLMFMSYHKHHMEGWTTFEVISGIYSQLIHAIQFSIFYLLAIKFRKNTIKHASYMVATGLIFINPSLTRTIGISSLTYPVVETIVIFFTDLCILSFIYLLRKKGHDYSAFVWILLIFQLHDIPMFIKIWQ